MNAPGVTLSPDQRAACRVFAARDLAAARALVREAGAWRTMPDDVAAHRYEDKRANARWCLRAAADMRRRALYYRRLAVCGVAPAGSGWRAS